MAQPPSVDGLSIWDNGYGILFISEWDKEIPPEKINTDVGNVTSIKIKNFIEDGRPGYSIKFKLDELCNENLKLFASASEKDGVLHAFQNIDTNYALKFVSNNKVGVHKTWTFWKVELTADDYVPLVGKGWRYLSFQGTGLPDVENHPESPFYNISDN